MTEPLRVELSYEGRSLCLALCGELTYGTAPMFDEHLAQAFDSTRPHLVLDVHGLQFCDSVGLSALIGAQRRADLAGGRMVLRSVHGMLERVLHITGAGVAVHRRRRRRGRSCRPCRRGQHGPRRRARLTCCRHPVDRHRPPLRRRSAGQARAQGRQARSTAATRSSGESSTLSPRASRP